MTDATVPQSGETTTPEVVTPETPEVAVPEVTKETPEATPEVAAE